MSWASHLYWANGCKDVGEWEGGHHHADGTSKFQGTRDSKEWREDQRTGALHPNMGIGRPYVNNSAH
jgi:hypothetical protein